MILAIFPAGSLSIRFCTKCQWPSTQALASNDVDARSDPCSRKSGLDPTADYGLYAVQEQEWAQLTACGLLKPTAENAPIKSTKV